MKSRIFVFYAGLLHGEYHIFPSLSGLGNEVYNGGYVWVKEQWFPHSIWEAPGWYRPDRTPCLIEDVPPELRAMALLLS